VREGDWVREIEEIERESKAYTLVLHSVKLYPHHVLGMCSLKQKDWSLELLSMCVVLRVLT
jgi:hypothetical protein